MVYVNSNNSDSNLPDFFVEQLRATGLLRESDSVLFNEGERGYSLSYWTAGKQWVKDQTKVDFQLLDKTGYVLSLMVYSGDRRRGIGSKLVGCIEELAKESRATCLKTTPSGQGKLFFPAIGFVPIGEDVEFEKRLK